MGVAAVSLGNRDWATSGGWGQLQMEPPVGGKGNLGREDQYVDGFQEEDFEDWNEEFLGDGWDGGKHGASYATISQPGNGGGIFLPNGGEIPPPNFAVKHTRPKRRRHVHAGVHQISNELDSEDDDSYASHKEEEGMATNAGGHLDENDPRHIYRNETWTQEHSSYGPILEQFYGVAGTTNHFHVFPSIIQLWDLFWPLQLLVKIMRETNRYAATVIHGLGNTMGGQKWKALTVVGLKAFLAIYIYMGL